MKIYKYNIPVVDFFELELPIGAKILCVQTQNEMPCIWAMVDPSAAKHPRRFSVIGTGHEIEFTTTLYIGTFQMMNGSFVGHLFELLTAEGRTARPRRRDQYPSPEQEAKEIGEK